MIEGIGQLDEGWRSGVRDNGAKTELFPGTSEGGILGGQPNISPPANDVELIERADEPEPEPKPEVAPPPAT